MTEQAEAESKQAKKGLLRICLIGIGVVVALLLIAFLYMYVTQRAADEEEVYSGSVADLLKEIAAAQDRYFEKHDSYGTFKQLVDEKMLKHKKLAAGTLGGYVYEMKLGEDGRDWGLTCWPEKPGEDTKSYFIDSRAEILFTEYTSESAEKANAESPPLWEEGGWETDD
jgi:hypothetical protein